MKKAVIYARVRNDNPQELIKRQIELCTQFATENGFYIVNTYIECEKLGMMTERRELAKMLSDSATSEWSAVIVQNYDRMTRNIEKLWLYRDTLENNGKKLFFVEGQNGNNENLTKTLKVLKERWQL